MQYFKIFQKMLLSVVMASMLSLPLADIAEDSAMTAFEVANVDVSFMADDNMPSEELFLKTELDLSFNLALALAENLPPHSLRLQPLVEPVVTDLYLKEVVYEIITPPKIAS